MRRQRAYDLEVDPRRLLGGELLHRLVEGRDALAELDQELMRAACPRGLAQSADSSVRADDLGQDRLLAVVGGHTQLDPVAELAQKPQQLVAPGLEEVAGERLLVVE